MNLVFVPTLLDGMTDVEMVVISIGRIVKMEASNQDGEISLGKVLNIQKETAVDVVNYKVKYILNSCYFKIWKN